MSSETTAIVPPIPPSDGAELVITPSWLPLDICEHNLAVFLNLEIDQKLTIEADYRVNLDARHLQFFRRKTDWLTSKHASNKENTYSVIKATYESLSQYPDFCGDHQIQIAKSLGVLKTTLVVTYSQYPELAELIKGFQSVYGHLTPPSPIKGLDLEVQTSIPFPLRAVPTSSLPRDLEWTNHVDDESPPLPTGEVNLSPKPHAPHPQMNWNPTQIKVAPPGPGLWERGWMKVFRLICPCCVPRKDLEAS